ncbi:MAG TPA: DUF4380 domain-containing protein [Polyangiaceae bacterium]
MDVQSRAPEYRGTSGLPAVDPKTLAALDPHASAAPSASASAPSNPVPPGAAGTPTLQADGSYLLSAGGLELLVDPKRGGRALRLSLDGKNVLAGPELLPDTYGAAFWPSPQSDWTWPPPPEIDAKPYAAELEGSVLVLKSQSSALGLSVSKRYRLDGARRSVDVSYTLLNTSQQARRVAPWEIHRVPAVGLSFYPSAGKLYPQSTLKLDTAPPITWFAHEQNREPRSVKAFADGAEGWLAYAREGLLLIKSFADTPAAQRAPGQGEIEIYADYDVATKQHRYVELAEQGPYVELAPGSSSTWSVRWLVRKLPPGIAVKPGNQQLVGFVRGVIQ